MICRMIGITYNWDEKDGDIKQSHLLGHLQTGGDIKRGTLTSYSPKGW